MLRISETPQSVAQGLFDFLTGENDADRATVAAALEADWRRTPGRENGLAQLKPRRRAIARVS
jgi:hypothetical protein